MKTFFKNLLSAIPFAFGAMLTLFSVVCAVNLDSGDNGFWAFFLGLIGIPILFASILSFLKEKP